MSEPDGRVPDPLLGELRAMWERRDPPPEGIADRVLVRLAMADLEREFELLSLVEVSSEALGARGGGDVVTLAFTGSSTDREMHLLVRVSPEGRDSCRIDGWLTPAAPMTVTVEQGTVEHLTVEHRARVDADGRFEIARVARGRTRFRLLPDPPADGTGLATPPVDL